MTPLYGSDVRSILNSLPPRICDVVHLWAERQPDHPALVEASGTWTYKQLDRAIEAAQSWLSNRGIRPGDRVLILGENCRAFIVIFLALSAMDTWPVVVNPRLSAREVNQIQNHCGARRTLYTIGVSPHAAEHAKNHNALMEDFLDLGLIGVGPLNEAAVPEPVDFDVENHVAVLIYTSGTTGLPKGVMLTHRNLLFTAAAAAMIRHLVPEDRMFGVLPMTHIVGLSVILLGTLMSGATLYLTPRFDPMSARALLEKEKLTVMLGVPSLYAQFVHYAKLRGVKRFSFPALRIISTSGAPLDQSLKTSVENLFGQVLHHGYGVTESSPNISQTRIELPRTDTSVGEPFPGVEVKLVGPEGNPVPNGEVGELWVRGPNIMKGYYRAPEETAAALDADGWFNTRDLARAEGRNLFIVGRTKDLIVRFGFNVYPAEVETVFNAHPEVMQSAVVGRSVEENEEIVAFIQLVPGSTLTTTQLAEYAAQQLGTYKRPTEIVLVEAMPLTPVGKVKKSELAKIAALGSEHR
ncbi:MAG TPA: AMP-binding protein [Candidatus Acidoferrum sp.]|nr:AMP-binding protein [Candidatus Acidoferrum sp.]